MCVAIGHALSASVFYCSLLLNVCDFNVVELFLGAEEMEGRGEAVWTSFTVNTLGREYISTILR
jgi:hypothetical protein